MNEETIFAEALQLHDPDQRAAFLDQACAGQPALLNEVQSLLSAYDSGEFLERPHAGLATLSLPPASESVGQQIGPYKLREVIGEGGMGTPGNAPRIVYEAASSARVAGAGGRGAGRDVVSFIAWHSPPLSRAVLRVGLRPPFDRRPIASAGDSAAVVRRMDQAIAFKRPSSVRSGQTKVPSARRVLRTSHSPSVPSHPKSNVITVAFVVFRFLQRQISRDTISGATQRAAMAMPQSVPIS